jgi:methylmalonyl-CoA decarboxylase
VVAEQQHVHWSVQDHIGAIAFGDTSCRNALSEALVDGLVGALHGLEERHARVALLRADTDRGVWSAGHAVTELPLGQRDPLGWNDPLRLLVRSIEEAPFPIIAVVDGSVWGGACETVLACDLIVATPDATFAITPARLGVPYNASGLLTFMNALPMGVLKELAFTAAPLRAADVAQYGFISRLVDASEIDAAAFDLADRIRRNSPLSVAVIKEQLRILAGAHSTTPRMFERLQGLRRVVYDSLDYTEGIRAFLEKRAPHFTGE